MTKSIECIITGRVQGVLYRDFAQKQAWLLGVTGEARNLSDGSVQVVAEGEETALKKFINVLKSGSSASRVDGVNIKWSESFRGFAGFEIVP